MSKFHQIQLFLPLDDDEDDDDEEDEVEELVGEPLDDDDGKGDSNRIIN